MQVTTATYIKHPAPSHLLLLLLHVVHATYISPTIVHMPLLLLLAHAAAAGVNVRHPTHMAPRDKHAVQPPLHARGDPREPVVGTAGSVGRARPPGGSSAVPSLEATTRGPQPGTRVRLQVGRQGGEGGKGKGASSQPWSRSAGG